MEETYYSKNREKQLALAKKYREEHREEYLAWQKNYYAENRARILRNRKTKRKGIKEKLPKKPSQKKGSEHLTKDEIVYELVVADGSAEPSFIRQAGNFTISWD